MSSQHLKGLDESWNVSLFVLDASSSTWFETSRQAIALALVEKINRNNHVGDVIFCRTSNNCSVGDSKECEQSWWKPNLTRLGGSDHAVLPYITKQLLLSLRRAEPTTSDTIVPNHSGTILHGLYEAYQLLISSRKSWTSDFAKVKSDCCNNKITITILMDGQKSIFAWPLELNDCMTTALESLKSFGCQLRIVWMEESESPLRKSEDSGISATDSRVLPAGVDENNCEAGNGNTSYFTWSTRTDRLNFWQEYFVKGEDRGGLVVASSPEEVISATLNIHWNNSTASKAAKVKMDLRITTELVIPVVVSTLIVKQSIPKVNNDKVTLINNDGSPAVNDLGQPLMDTYFRETFRIDADGGIVNPDDIVKVFDFTSDSQIPVCPFDYLTMHPLCLQSIEKSTFQVLGFMPELRLPRCYLKGPPKVISGDYTGADVHQTLVTVAALAQALKLEKSIGICALLPKSNVLHNRPTSFTIGVLYPFQPLPKDGPAEASSLDTQLLFLQLPFEDNLRNVPSTVVEVNTTHFGTNSDVSNSRACNDLIDAMLLPRGNLSPGSITLPALRKWKQLATQRFFKEGAHGAHHGTCCGKDGIYIHEFLKSNAESTLDQFWSVFRFENEKLKSKSTDQGENGVDVRKKAKFGNYYKGSL